MNREIKFRAWDKKDCLMIPNIQNVYDSEPRDGAGIFDAFGQFLPNGNWLNGNRYEVMQFTGVKDKNGKEIYEGDILKSSGSGIRTIVRWEQDICCEYGCVGWEGISEGDWNDCYTSKDAEVIGNIFENGDWLNENGYLLSENDTRPKAN